MCCFCCFICSSSICVYGDNRSVVNRSYIRYIFYILYTEILFDIVNYFNLINETISMDFSIANDTILWYTSISLHYWQFVFEYSMLFSVENKAELRIAKLMFILSWYLHLFVHLPNKRPPSTIQPSIHSPSTHHHLRLKVSMAITVRTTQ